MDWLWCDTRPVFSPNEKGDGPTLFIFFLGRKPDFALHWYHQDQEFADPYDEESRNFQYGFRGGIDDTYRWLDKNSETGGAPDSKKVPLLVHHLWGPPDAWIAQPSGK